MTTLKASSIDLKVRSKVLEEMEGGKEGDEAA